MTTFPEAHLIEPTDFNAAICPTDHRIGQITFRVENRELYHVVLSRNDLQQLSREIERELKATPLPFGGH